MLGLAAILCLAFLGLQRACPDTPTKVERRVDSVLMDTTHFLAERHRRDSIIAAGQVETARLRKQNQALKQSVRTLLDSVDHERTEAATLTPLPSGITAHDSIVRLDSALHAQIQVAARLRDDVIPRLQQVIRLDSLTIDRQDATIADQTLALRTEWKRNDQLTQALRDLRKQGNGKVLGFLPSWTDEAVLVVGAAYAGYKVGKS